MEMIRLYVAARTKASMQGSSDVKARVRDTLGISNTRLPLARLAQLDDFFTARNAIVHDLDYLSPKGMGTARHARPQDWVRDQCDLVFAVVAETINETAANIRVLKTPLPPPSGQKPPTPDELKLASAYAALLTRVSTCAQAVEDGSWRHLETGAGRVVTAATDLEAAAKVLPAGTMDSRLVMAELMRLAESNTAVKALHPPD